MAELALHRAVPDRPLTSTRRALERRGAAARRALHRRCSGWRRGPRHRRCRCMIQLARRQHRVAHTPIAPLLVIAGGLALRFVIVQPGRSATGPAFPALLSIDLQDRWRSGPHVPPDITHRSPPRAPTALHESIPRRHRPRARAARGVRHHGPRPRRLGRLRSACAGRSTPSRRRTRRRNEYLAGYLGDGSAHPLKEWLVFEVIGVSSGGFFSGLLAGRVPAVEKGPRISTRGRLPALSPAAC